MSIKIYEVKASPMTKKKLDDLWGYKYPMDRIGPCECGCTRWILLPKNSAVVVEGGKFYMVCVDCGVFSHL